MFNDHAWCGSAAKFSSSATRHQQVAAIVVGGGPAGIAVLGNLLEKIDKGKITWVDPQFKGGRINRKYREVPSNTKAGLFLGYAQAVKPFQEVIENTPTPNAATKLEELPQDSTCSLHLAGDMLQMLSDGLVKNKRVEYCRGRVTEAIWIERDSEWSLKIEGLSPHDRESRTSPLVVYCTGASPTTVALPTPSSSPPKLLDLDTALKPSDLTQAIPQDRETTVGVIGASHSAILVLMNIFKLSQSTHSQLRVRWFARSPHLKYAVYKDGWILYDNTGLKGEAAQFGKDQLDGEKLEFSDAGKIIRRIDCSGGAEKEREAFERVLPDCDYVVQAVGFTNDELPTMKQKVEYDHETGGFLDAKTGKVVNGLFGAGIAFPERVVDPAGNVEYAVGFAKFMKYIKRVSPEWVAKTR
ncbi:pyridine nucleotide-disulfide oxidoreductase-domain-containing protein [Xylariales sp. AK1849]|nr:pyridine nucleotide-disulfide oxidoreductase-domain-containing protein [Xylariales sp. AK1849]